MKKTVRNSKATFALIKSKNTDLMYIAMMIDDHPAKVWKLDDISPAGIDLLNEMFRAYDLGYTMEYQLPTEVDGKRQIVPIVYDLDDDKPGKVKPDTKTIVDKLLGNGPVPQFGEYDADAPDSIISEQCGVDEEQLTKALESLPEEKSEIKLVEDDITDILETPINEQGTDESTEEPQLFADDDEILIDDDEPIASVSESIDDEYDEEEAMLIEDASSVVSVAESISESISEKTDALDETLENHPDNDEKSDILEAVSESAPENSADSEKIVEKEPDSHDAEVKDVHPVEEIKPHASKRIMPDPIENPIYDEPVEQEKPETVPEKPKKTVKHCPNGHNITTGKFCTVCGAKLVEIEVDK